MIAGRQSLPERAPRACPAKTGDRHEPDLGIPESILDHFLLDQDEVGPRRALRDDMSITLVMHLI